MKVLVRKTFGFVDMLWDTYIHNNSSNLQFVILTYFDMVLVKFYL